MLSKEEGRKASERIVHAWDEMSRLHWMLEVKPGNKAETKRVETILVKLLELHDIIKSETE